MQVEHVHWSVFFCGANPAPKPVNGWNAGGAGAAEAAGAAEGFGAGAPAGRGSSQTTHFCADPGLLHEHREQVHSALEVEASAVGAADAAAVVGTENPEEKLGLLAVLGFGSSHTTHFSADEGLMQEQREQVQSAPDAALGAEVEAAAGLNTNPWVGAEVDACGAEIVVVAEPFEDRLKLNTGTSRLSAAALTLSEGRLCSPLSDGPSVNV